MSIPLIFVHFGKSDWLELCIRQARSSNPGLEIHLLGDAENSYLGTLCHHHGYADYNSGAGQLSQVYRHFSSNSQAFEYFCINRWFMINAFIKANGIDRAFVSDSDFLLYEDLRTFVQSQPALMNYEAAYCILDQRYEDYTWLASGHFSMVSTSFLDKFCAFVLHLYTTDPGILEAKISYNKQHNIVYGGISDMALLYLFYLKNQESVCNLLIPINDRVVDLDINSGVNFRFNEFRVNKRSKLIRFNGNKPFGMTRQGKEYAFIGLHFQGNAKFYLVDYYTGKMVPAVIRQKIHKWYCHLVDAVRAFSNKDAPGRYRPAQ